MASNRQLATALILYRLKINYSNLARASFRTRPSQIVYNYVVSCRLNDHRLFNFNVLILPMNYV